MIAWIPSAAESALLAALLLGLCCGTLGAFVVVRRMALTGDMLSHAVLPGIVAGIVWNTSRDPLVVLGTALLAGMAGTGVMHAIQRTTRLKPDAALGIVLSVFFAAGIALISMKQPSGVQAYLYGQVAALDPRDLAMLGGVTVIVIATITLLFRVLHVSSFDAGFARLLGYPVVWIERLFFFLLAAAIVVAMQAVGVVLVSAMLIAPAAAARRLTRRFGRVVIFSCLLGAIGALTGVGISGVKAGLPTGPMIALSVTGVFFLVTLASPYDGLVVKWWRHQAMRRRIERENALKAVFHVLERDGFRHDAVPVFELARHSGSTLPAAEKRAKGLVERGDAVWTGGRSGVLFTTEGRRRAEEIVRNHRLWERYLTERAAYAPDHVHDDAERVEHWIDEEKVRRLEEALDFPEKDPHGRAIPVVGRDGKEGA
jgi:ABC-type Mn2+/Zn2+ transport system permease subunit/Mn-dependent DtxR family transcriptional regulator